MDDKFYIEGKIRMKQAARGVFFSACFVLPSCLAYRWTAKMEVACSFETSMLLHLTVRSYIPEDTTIHSDRCENLMSDPSVHFVELLRRILYSFSRRNF
jgi:hypothetical protein